MIDPFVYSTWTAFKAIAVTRKNLTLQFHDLGEVVTVVGPDQNDINLLVNIRKTLDDGSENPEYADFRDNYQSACNWPVGVKRSPFATSDYEFAPQRAAETCPAGGSKSIFVGFTEPLRVNGGRIIFDSNAVFGDWVEVQLVDHDNILGAGVDFVLKNWVPRWDLNPNKGESEITTPYAGAIPTGFYLRMTYHSTGSNDVKFVLNVTAHRPI